jgi:hypothetical protein
MPRKRNQHVRRRKAGLSFPFLDLPPDLQLHVLSFLNLQTLKNAVSCSSHISFLYTKYPETFLQAAMHHHGQQIRNLILTTLSITRSIDSINTHLRPDVDDLGKYFAHHLDTDVTAHILKTNEYPIQVLDMLYALDLEVRSLVHDYALDAYRRACHFDNPGAVVPPLILSPSENLRITRAFWRLKLYGVLFYNYADHFGLDLSHAYSTFFNRLCEWEIDEMVTVYQYMVRNRYYFNSASPHIDCPFANQPMHRNRDPFECPNCQGRHLFNVNRNQAFSRVIEDNYLHGNGSLWASPFKCSFRYKPVKVWDESPDENMRSGGYCLVYALSPGSPSSKELFVQLRNRGVYFWDQERLKGWDAWDEFEDRFKDPDEICDICGTICSV